MKIEKHEETSSPYSILKVEKLNNCSVGMKFSAATLQCRS